jgi:hypothetical protein
MGSGVFSSHVLAIFPIHALMEDFDLNSGLFRAVVSSRQTQRRDTAENTAIV